MRFFLDVNMGNMVQMKLYNSMEKQGDWGGIGPYLVWIVYHAIFLCNYKS